MLHCLAEMPGVTIDDHELHFTRSGKGPPLLLIQGLGGHTAHWGAHFPALLAQKLDVIAFDHVGTGRSQPLDTHLQHGTGRDLSIRGMARDAAGLLAALGLERAHVLGLSMGGMVAQALALERAELVERLVLMGTSPSAPRGARTPRESIEALMSAWTSGDPERAIRTGLKVNVSARYAAEPGTLDAWRETAVDHPVGLPVLGAQLEAIRGHDALDDLAEMQMPTLIVHGTDDRILPVGNAHLLAGVIPNAQLELLDGVGHLSYLEQPECVAGLVLEFLLD